MSDFIVKIEYKDTGENGELETVVEKEYGLPQYTDMLYSSLMSILRDVENAFYYFSNGEQKKDWEPEALSQFKTIRSKILDEANAIRRIPQNLSYRGISAASIPASEWIAGLVDGK